MAPFLGAFFVCGAYGAYNQSIADNRLRIFAQAIIRKVLVIRYFAATILLLGGLTLAYIYWQMISMLWMDNFFDPIVWNPEIRGWQIFLIAGRFVGLTLLYVLCWIFIRRINRGLESGDIFPPSNISLIRWAALVCVLLAFVRANFSAAMQRESSLMLDSNVFLIPLIVLLFDELYKMAYLAAKDSKLAI